MVVHLNPQTKPGLKPYVPLVVVRSRAEWRAWLSAHHGQTTAVWAVTVKKSALTPGEDFVSAIDLNEECLCFGWIDSKPGRIDERYTALLCTPRKPGSGWSKVNKDRLERLFADGAVTAAGKRVIAAAKADGSWTKLDATDAHEVPDDLANALAAYKQATSNFTAFPPSTRRGTSNGSHKPRPRPHVPNASTKPHDSPMTTSEPTSGPVNTTDSPSIGTRQSLTPTQTD